MASHNRPFMPSISWLLNLMEQLYFTFQFWSVRIPPLELEEKYNAHLEKIYHLVTAYLNLDKFLEDWFVLLPSERCGPAFREKFHRTKRMSQNLYEQFHNMENRIKGLFD